LKGLVRVRSKELDEQVSNEVNELYRRTRES
jgi:hypothetical protein